MPKPLEILGGTPRPQARAVISLFGLATMMVCVGASGVGAQPATTPDGGDHPVVREIRVEGLDSITTETVLRAMTTRAGRTLDADALRRDQESIVNLGYFDPLSLAVRSEPADGGVRLIVSLRENPRVKSITIVGNVKFNETQIRERLPFKEGDILPAKAQEEVRKSLRRFYGEGGYHQVRVDLRAIEAGAGRVEAAIYINEGERLRIGDLILRGNNSYPGAWLKPRLINHGSWLFFDNFYDDDLFKSDMETLRSFYMDHGFLDVRVSRGTPVPGKKKAEINPVIDIEEGPRYKVGAITIRGNALFLDDEVRKPFRFLPRRDYSGDALRKAIAALRTLYGDEGYIDLKVDVRTIPVRESKIVNIELDLKEGEVVYVGDVKVRFHRLELEEKPNALERFFLWISPAVTEETVKREVRLKPGEKYRAFQEVRTKERLDNLQVFEKVGVTREPTADPQVRDAVVEAEDSQNAGFISAMVGYGDVTGPALTLGYTNPNIGGEANPLNMSATFGRDTRRYTIRYLERYLGKSDYSLDTRLYRFDDRWEGYRERTYGGSSELGKPLNEYLTAYMRLRLEDVKFRYREERREEPLTPYQTVAMRGMLNYDRRDNQRWPTRGFFVAGGVEGGHADGGLLKFLHSFGWYKNIYNGLIFAYEHDAGVIPYRSSRVGITERFFLGGSSDVRGFRVRGASPTDRGYRRLRVGGSTKFAQRSELRFPILGALKGRVFFDDGFIDKRPWNFRNPRASTGVGFVVDLKMVSVEVDFARAILYQEGDARRFLHFRISSGF